MIHQILAVLYHLIYILDGHFLKFLQGRGATNEVHQ